MKKFLALSVIVLAALFSAGCNVGGGSEESPPSDVRVNAGDGGVTVTWTMQPGVEYWLFIAAAPSINTGNWASLPQARAIRNASSPQVVTGLTNGTTYSFTVNARSEGGPGGPGSASVSAVPRLAGISWVLGTALPAANLRALGFIALTFPGIFTAVGDAGAAFISNDGISWAPVTTGVTTNLNGVVYGGGKYVAVGTGGVVISSLDAGSWVTVNSGTTNDLNAIALGSSGLVAVGNNGTMIRSNDGGNTWVQQPVVTSNHLYGVSFAVNQYVAVGANGTVLTSSDGDVWTVRPTPTVEALRSVVYSTTLGLHVAVGAAGTMLSSRDAITWTAIAPVTVKQLNSITVGNQFTAVGDGGTIVASLDGVNWQIVASGTANNLNAVIFGLVGYAAVGVGGVNLTSY